VACAAEHGFWYRFKASGGSAAGKQPPGGAAASGGDGGWQTNYADRQMTW
jgi:hypothetical protein